VRILFYADAWSEYQHWIAHDTGVAVRLNSLIRDAMRSPFAGIGKPEPLKGDLSGWWSRRITGEHRLVYRVVGQAGADKRLEIISCRFHYQAR
jgi:toxin YoeB